MDTSIAGIPDAIYKPNAITTTTAIMGKDSSQLDMDDFFKLLVAQMSNQDMMDPQSNTEFISQMAQFTSLQGIQTLGEYQLSAYAVSYVGKNVVIAQQNEATGALETFSGVVETVTFYDGKPMVIVNGKAYDLHKVMEISVSPAKKEEETKTEDKTISEEESIANKEALDNAAYYIGKTVTVESKNARGEIEQIYGQVTSVTAQSGKAKIEVKGKFYELDAIVTLWDD